MMKKKNKNAPWGRSGRRATWAWWWRRIRRSTASQPPPPPPLPPRRSRSPARTATKTSNLPFFLFFFWSENRDDHCADHPPSDRKNPSIDRSIGVARADGGVEASEAELGCVSWSEREEKRREEEGVVVEEGKKEKETIYTIQQQ